MIENFWISTEKAMPTKDGQYFVAYKEDYSIYARQYNVLRYVSSPVNEPGNMFAFDSTDPGFYEYGNPDYDAYEYINETEMIDYWAYIPPVI